MSAGGLQMNKCGVRSCFQKHNPGLITCGNFHNCRRWIHPECSDKKVFKLDLLPTKDENGAEVWTCTRACHSAIKSSMSSKKMLWDKDGPNGPDDPINSEAILLNWITEGNNYRNYRGNKHGITKKQYCKQIADLIKAQGIKAERTADNIFDKIRQMESKFKEAHDWSTTATGVGLQENDEGTFRDAVTKKCRYYYDLLPTLQDRVTFNAETNEDMEDDGFGEVGGPNPSDESGSEDEDDDKENEEPAGAADKILRLRGGDVGSTSPKAVTTRKATALPETPSVGDNENTDSSPTSKDGTSNPTSKQKTSSTNSAKKTTSTGSANKKKRSAEKKTETTQKKAPRVSTKQQVKNEYMESFITQAQELSQVEEGHNQRRHNENVLLRKREMHANEARFKKQLELDSLRFNLETERLDLERKAMKKKLQEDEHEAMRKKSEELDVLIQQGKSDIYIRRMRPYLIPVLEEFRAVEALENEASAM